MPNLTDSSDAELVDMTTAGEHEAYKELVTRYQGHGFRKKANRDYFEQAGVLSPEQLVL